MTVCYIGAGSNIGGRLAYIRKAIALLKKTPGIRVKKVSPVYESRPQGGPKGQGDYLNCVIKIDSSLSPKKLLMALKSIERKLGRKPRKRRWAKREIDLDILLYGRQVVRDKALSVPHPLMHKRSFVLEPLSDIAPRLKHPILKKSIKILLKALILKK